MRSLKGKIGLIVIFLVSFIPVLIWISLRPLAFRFENAYLTLTSVGQLTALIGITLFSMGMVLSARLKFLEPYFGGLDRMYNVHHIVGTLAFIFLLVHPLVLSVRYISMSFYDAGAFLLPSADWPRNFGIFSLALFIGLLYATFFAKWKYQVRRFAHQILGVAFFLGALHTFFIPSDISNNAILKYPMFLLVAFALAAFSYRTLFGRTTIHRFDYTVGAVNLLDETVTEVVLFPDRKEENEKMHYEPGQFLFMSIKSDEVIPEVHPFSISSSSDEPVIRITSKALGDYTTTLRSLKVGATAKLEGPFGSFSYIHGKNIKQIWIAGGIGITPFLSMARYLKDHTETGHQVDFYYSTKTRQEMIFLEELNQISAVYPNFRVFPFNADEFGFLNMDAVEKMSQDIVGKDIYVCGPPPMMHSIVAQCKGKGVPRSLIHSEEFKLL